MDNLTPRQKTILVRLHYRTKPVSINDDLRAARVPGETRPMGYDQAYEACRGLERRGLVRRLPGRPATWEKV